MTLREFTKRAKHPALIGYLVLAGGIIGGFIVNENHNEDSRKAVVKSGQATAIVGCNRDYDQAIRARESVREDYREGIHQLQLFVKEGTLTDAQGVRALRVSKKQKDKRLGNIPLPDCREPLSILTSDPDEDIRVPQPKYPGYRKD